MKIKYYKFLMLIAISIILFILWKLISFMIWPFIIIGIGYFVWKKWFK